MTAAARPHDLSLAAIAVAAAPLLFAGLTLMACATGSDASPLAWHVVTTALGLFCIGAAGLLFLIEERT